MIKLDCRRCSTGIFMFDDINGFGNLPKRWACHICGMQYIVKLDENGRPAVFYRQGKGRWRKMDIAGLKPAVLPAEPEVIEPAPKPIEPAPSPEELAAAPLPSQTETTGESPGPVNEGTAEEGE